MARRPTSRLGLPNSATRIALAEAQVFCVVKSGNELGCMGVPCKLTIEGRPVFLCCEHCKDAALKDPKATLAALDGLLQKNSARVQTNTR